jgi:long-chain acyl-CoA synthetase
MDPQKITTINDVFELIVSRWRDRVLLTRRAGQWVPFSSEDVYRSVAAIARTLTAWGLRQGDRVAILSENRAEWAIADFACLAIGCADVPIYPTLTPEQMSFILNDAEVRVVFCSSNELVQKVLAILPHTRVEKVVAMDDDVPLSSALSFQALLHGFPAGRDAEFDNRRAAVRPDDPASIVYTSGTTGVSKGVVLTHGNLASNLVHSLEIFGLQPDDVSISCLPLSHITARHADYAMFQYGVTVAYCPNINQLAEVLLEVRPTFFVGVPRLYEKVRGEVERRVGPGVKAAVFRWALEVGRRHRGEILAGKRPASLAWRIANALVYSKIGGGFGGRVHTFISGGAPLGREVAEWYALVGIRIYEGYGLTETSPVIAVNTPVDYRIGTVGKPLPNVQCRIAADGELEVSGPSVFREYWRRPEETAAAFTPDGWFRTGDIAVIDQDGFLAITDRKKDLIKTSGGKFIAPQPIENSLKSNVLIAQAGIIGERRKFPMVVIQPHFPVLEDWARANQVAVASRGELVAHPKVQALYEGIVDDLNQRLAQFEKLKKVLLVPDEFGIASGELTPTLKLKRRNVEERYRAQIDAIYNTASKATPEAVAR